MAIKKASKKSAGILLYRIVQNKFDFFLVHPGGPFWANKDAGAWSIPKGEPDDNEMIFEVVQREFEEETGTRPKGNFISLTPIVQKAGKEVYCWALEGEIDPKSIRSNNFEIEWPPRSGKKKMYPEVDKAAWFDSDTAKEKINPAQVSFIEELMLKLSS